MASEPLRVVVTGAAGQIAYSLLYQIASGQVFGSDRKLILHLLDITPMMPVLGGVVMELDDCAFPLLAKVVPTDDLEVAFKDVDAAFLVGAMPRKEGMERKDLLAANVKIFKAQGQALDLYAKQSVKVLVVGNPANTNALICSHFARNLPKANFTALTRLDQNRAQAQLALKAGVPVHQVKNVIIWGNHSATQVPDASHATIDGKPAAEVIADPAWLVETFVPTVQKRGASVIAARKLSSAMSAAKAAADHMRTWFLGTSDGELTSMAVISAGEYGAPEGVIYSFPCTVTNGDWFIQQDLALDEAVMAKMAITGEELIAEKKEAMVVCAD